MARSAPRRTQAIRVVTRTGCIPGKNVMWSEFCDLVRMAARVRVTPEGFPRGWSNASIINSARKISGGPATLCERCKTEIALANALDAEPDVNRRRRELLAGGEHPLSGDFLRKAIGASALGDPVHQLRRALAGSRYRVETHRGDEYELTAGKRPRVRRGRPTRLGI